MDKIGLGLVEETDEELYALLDKAMEDERLCVSEELIQKTLKRVEESPASTGVHHKSKNYSRLIRWGSVAAAAVLVVFVGSRMLAGGFYMDKGSMECAPDEVNSLNGYGYMSEAEPSTEKPAGDSYFYRCYGTAMESYDMVDEGVATNESKTAKDRDIVTESLLDDVQVTDGYGDRIPSESILLSTEFCELLAQAGYDTTDTAAQFWCLNPLSAKHWEEEATIALTTEKEAPETETAMPKVSGGAISSEQQLHYAVKVATTEGSLWILVGEEVYFVMDRE